MKFTPFGGVALSPINCVTMNHQNQLKQMANGATFATATCGGREES
jgi:hypothetical protein